MFEVCFYEISLKMLGRHGTMTRNQGGFQMPPVAFDALGVGLSAHESPAMSHTPMAKADASHFAVAGELIGVERALQIRVGPTQRVDRSRQRQQIDAFGGLRGTFLMGKAAL